VTLQSHGTRPAADPIAREIKRLAPWFHNLHLPTGHETAPDHPLGDFPRVKWWELSSALPEDLSGWRALDVGCNAGFYSFALARRGAEVLAIDADEHYLRQARWAAQQFELADSIRFERVQVYDLARGADRFDLVLFLGVLYHLRHPLLALDLLAEKTERLLVLQTLTMLGDGEVEPPKNLPIDARERLLEPGWPKMAFVERRLADDPTNWWAPNAACAEAMLRSSGL
jgi:tRNA (mo5U34)-methyltransferase